MVNRSMCAALFAVATLACSSTTRSFDGPEGRSLDTDGGAPSHPDLRDGAAACTGVALGTGHRPLDLFIMLDRSGSMKGAPWEQARSALNDFFANPPSGDLAAALNYFPK